MKNLDDFTPLTTLPDDSSVATAVAKINELVNHLNLVIPKLNGDDGLVEE